ncbi:MAG: hypothetical protein ONB49_20820 [candidate division KSB1 bacterium]|nr:hypothetical protein [candidate division KSB1 bacterium]
MKIILCLKQVPLKDSLLKITADGRWIDETALQFEINESDHYGLEVENFRVHAYAEEDHGDAALGCVVEGEHRLRDVHRRASHQVERSPEEAHVVRQSAGRRDRDVHREDGVRVRGAGQEVGRPLVPHRRRRPPLPRHDG